MKKLVPVYSVVVVAFCFGGCFLVAASSRTQAEAFARAHIAKLNWTRRHPFKLKKIKKVMDLYRKTKKPGAFLFTELETPEL